MLLKKRIPQKKNLAMFLIDEIFFEKQKKRKTEVKGLKTVRGRRTGRLTPEQAARIMGVTTRFVHMGLQCGKLHFGYAMHTSPKRWTYFISVAKFEEETGLQVPQEILDENAALEGACVAPSAM